MQMYADVTGRPLSLIGSAQGPALGAAIHAAVAAGEYPSVPAAAAVMGRIQRNVYRPDPGTSWAYDALHARVHPAARLLRPGENKVMHRLREIGARAVTVA